MLKDLRLSIQRLSGFRSLGILGFRIQEFAQPVIALQTLLPCVVKVEQAYVVSAYVGMHARTCMHVYKSTHVHLHLHICP